MNIHCPSCGSLLQNDDMNLANMVGKCRRCHALVNLRDFITDSARPALVAAPRPRDDVPLPPGLAVDDTGVALTLTRRWFSYFLILQAFFCVAWDGFLVFWYTTAFSMDSPWIMKVFPVLHVAVGVGITYATLAGFLNRTIIRADWNELTVRHVPLPWFGNCRVPVDQLEQLCSQEERHQCNSGVRCSYKVGAVPKEGKKTTLVSGLTDQDQALFIEQRIERYLRIQDRPVPGELPR
jgi:hypothetical protein